MLTAIRNNDPKLKKIAEDDHIFKDEDFDVKNAGDGKKEKGVFLKDQIRERALEKLKKQSDAESESSSDESARESEAGEVKNVEQRESKLFEKIGVPLNE